ncbi:MAG: hypothetical protein Q4D97_01240 [Eubacteriales bacterium]|nr:hypothetical protein [Eubacteriales bacterium]
MLGQTLDFICLILLLALAWEDLRYRQVGLGKILGLALLAWFNGPQQLGANWSWLPALGSSLFFLFLLLLVQGLERSRGRFYLGEADLLVLAALAPQEGCWSCLFMASLASVFCLISMVLLFVLRRRMAGHLVSSQNKGQDRLVLPLLPFYCLAWLLQRI